MLLLGLQGLLLTGLLLLGLLLTGPLTVHHQHWQLSLSPSPLLSLLLPLPLPLSLQFSLFVLLLLLLPRLRKRRGQRRRRAPNTLHPKRTQTKSNHRCCQRIVVRRILQINRIGNTPALRFIWCLPSERKDGMERDGTLSSNQFSRFQTGLGGVSGSAAVTVLARVLPLSVGVHDVHQHHVLTRGVPVTIQLSGSPGVVCEVHVRSSRMASAKTTTARVVLHDRLA